MRTDRRTFVKVMAGSAGALLLGVRASAQEPAAQPFKPNVWLRIDADGTITVKVGKSEMGQGVRTALPMILAEELDAPLESIRIEQASPGAEFTRLGTGGSGSIMGMYDPLRMAGATAKQLLVAAAAAKWGVEAASLTTRDGAVHHAASNRRATYGELASAAATAAVQHAAELKPRSAFKLIGQPKKRIDGPDIVTGRARYGLDVRVPGMLFAVVARSPKLGAKVLSFDATKAKAAEGVRHVVQIPTGVAVVADNTWAAIRGRELLAIEWGESPHATFDSREHIKALERAVEQPALNIRKDGEGRAAFGKAAKTIERTYSYPFAAHASLEPVNCTALVTDDKATLWSPTQAPNTVHGAAAQLLGLPESAITVNVMLLGGGFGRRLGIDFDREAMEVARQIKGTPVQLVWTREDDMKHGYFQAASVHRLATGLDGDGKIVAWEHRKASSPHNARRQPTAEDKTNPQTVGGWAWGVKDTPYSWPAAEMSYAVIDSPIPIGPWRSVFSPSSVFARESFLDEVAIETGQDPLKFRLPLVNARMRKVLETLAAKSGWDTPVAKGRARGLAINVFHTETYIGYVVEVSLPFKVERVVCAVDCGLAINPLGVAQQVESGVIWSLSNMLGEITAKNGEIEQAYYSDFPVAMIRDTPRVIETHIVPSDDERPHGLGEPAVCPFAPAAANGLSRLTGTRVRKLPV